MEHIIHVGDVAYVPVSDVLIEGGCVREHIIHVGDG